MTQSSQKYLMSQPSQLLVGPTWMLTGSTDTEVRVWKIGKSKRGSLAVDCVYRLIGHECAVSCVRFGQMEVVSGDVKGRIFIWWMKTGQILRRCQVHTSPVKCMQFDALHIVSGGADHSVCITDIATGEVRPYFVHLCSCIANIPVHHIPNTTIGAADAARAHVGGDRAGLRL